jgi:hypothetical protein
VTPEQVNLSSVPHKGNTRKKSEDEHRDTPEVCQRGSWGQPVSKVCGKSPVVHQTSRLTHETVVLGKEEQV